MRTTTLVALLASLLVLASACDRENGESGVASPDGESADLVVYVVNYPLKYFAERIGGEGVDVRFPVPAGEDPAYWTPAADVVAAYQKADLILLNGAGYAGWIAKSTLPPSRLVDTSAGFRDRYIPLEAAVTHSHGPEGAHEHGGWAFTTWLDPTLALEQARAITDALATARPAGEDLFRERLAGLESDLTALDQRLAAATSRIGDRPLVFSHPVYQYLERRYGLNARSLHWEPDAAPDLSELRQLLDEHPARWMIWEGQPPEPTIRDLDGLGLASVVFEPCGNVSEAGDLLAVMASNAAALERIAD